MKNLNLFTRRLNFYLIIIILFSFNYCNTFSREDSKLIDGVRKYLIDYYFKINYQVDIIEIRLNNHNEIVSRGTDSLIKRSFENELYRIAIKLSNHENLDDYLNSVKNGEPNFMDEAIKSNEYLSFVENLKKYIGQNSNEVHVYLKYVTINQNGKKSNHLNENKVFLLSKSFDVIAVIK